MGCETSPWAWTVRETSVLVFLGQLLGKFSSLGADALAGSSLFRSTGYSSSLEENLPLFLGDTLVSWLFRVTNWFLYRERSVPLGRLPPLAISSRSPLTSSSLEDDFFFLGLEKDTDDSSILFSWCGSWGLHFLLLRSCTHLLALLLSTAAVFQKCKGNCSKTFFFFFKHFFCFSSFLVISASASSAWTIISITTSRFLQGTSSVSQKDSCSSTCSWSFSTNTAEGTSEKQSVYKVIQHLFARYWEMRPLLSMAAWPINVEWKMRTYFGVLSVVFGALETWSLSWVQGSTYRPGLAKQASSYLSDTLVSKKLMVLKNWILIDRKSNHKKQCGF